MIATKQGKYKYQRGMKQKYDSVDAFTTTTTPRQYALPNTPHTSPRSKKDRRTIRKAPSTQEK